MAEVSVDEIKQRTGISDTQLDTRIQEDKLWDIAGLLGDYKFYVETPGFGLKKADKVDLKATSTSVGNRYAMVEAFKKWFNVSKDVVTYRSLAKILLELEKGSEAEAVCEFGELLATNM